MATNNIRALRTVAKQLEISRDEKDILVVALKLLGKYAGDKATSLRSGADPYYCLDFTVLSHVCDRLTDSLETLFAPPVPARHDPELWSNLLKDLTFNDQAKLGR